LFASLPPHPPLPPTAGNCHELVDAVLKHGDATALIAAGILRGACEEPPAAATALGKHRALAQVTSYLKKLAANGTAAALYGNDPKWAPVALAVEASIDHLHAKLLDVGEAVRAVNAGGTAAICAEIQKHAAAGDITDTLYEAAAKSCALEPDHAHYLEKAALAAAQTLQADLSSRQEVSPPEPLEFGKLGATRVHGLF